MLKGTIFNVLTGKMIFRMSLVLGKNANASLSNDGFVCHVYIFLGWITLNAKKLTTLMKFC